MTTVENWTGLARTLVLSGLLCLPLAAQSTVVHAQQGGALLDKVCKATADEIVREHGVINFNTIQKEIDANNTEVDRLNVRIRENAAAVAGAPAGSYYYTEDQLRSDREWVARIQVQIDCLEKIRKLVELSKRPDPLPGINLTRPQALILKPMTDLLFRKMGRVTSDYARYNQLISRRATLVRGLSRIPGTRRLLPLPKAKLKAVRKTPRVTKTKVFRDVVIPKDGAPRLTVVPGLTPNVPVGNPKGGDIGLDFDVMYDRTWGPDLKIGWGPGGQPWHRFDNDGGIVLPGVKLWFVLPNPIVGDQTRFGLNVYGGVASGKERRPDVTQPGFITVIDGSNPFLTPITATRNTRYDWDRYKVAGSLWGAADVRVWRNRLMLTLLFGLYFAYDHYKQTVSEEVSGGGPFFTNNLAFKMAVAFYGVRLGLYATQWLTGALSVTYGGSVIPGYQTYKLTATQTGTALGDASAGNRDDGFAARFEFGAKLNYDATQRLRLTFGINGTYDTSAPDVDYPNAGGFAVRAERRAAWGMKVGVNLRWAF